MTICQFLFSRITQMFLIGKFEDGAWSNLDSITFDSDPDHRLNT